MNQSLQQQPKSPANTVNTGKVERVMEQVIASFRRHNLNEIEVAFVLKTLIEGHMVAMAEKSPIILSA